MWFANIKVILQYDSIVGAGCSLDGGATRKTVEKSEKLTNNLFFIAI